MKRNWLKTAVSMLMVCILALSAAACSSSNATDAPTATPAATDTPMATPEPTQEPTPTPDATDEPVADVYETKLAEVPGSWNPHTWVNAIEMVMLEYVTVPIVANITSTKFVNKAATEVTDITATFTDKSKWNLGGAINSYVYQIDLNPQMKWEDGTPINADSYIYSMQQLLDPAMKNFRASRYSVGAEAIRGAFKYTNKDKAGQPMYASAMDASTNENTVYYVNPTVACFFFNNDSMKTYYEAGFAPNFINDDDVDLYQKYAASGDYVEVTDEVKADLLVLAVAFGDKNPEAWVEFCFVQNGVYPDATWDDVGLLKTGEYQIVIITEKPMAMDKFQVLMKRNWLVHEATYEAGKKTENGVTTTNYNIPGGVTMSYGPYKLVSFEVGKEIILEKNENWYGWAEGATDEVYTYEKFGTQNTVRIALPEVKTTAATPGASSAPGETHAFPFAFETQDVAGNTVTAESIGEKEVFFVHLWATWCGPCVSEMGDLREIYNMYSDRVGFIALVDDFDDNAKGAQRLLDYNELEIISVNSKVPELSGVLEMLKSGYVPTTIIIDGEGNIIGEQIIGSYGMEYAGFIDAALDEVNK